MPPTGPIIVKIGGVALEQQSASPALWRALLALHASHPGGLVLAHGGGKAVDRLMDRLGLTSERQEGIRITPSEHMDIIAGVLAGATNKSLVGVINAAAAPGQARAVGLCLGDGGAFTTTKTTRYAFDPGRVGEVTGGDARLITTLLRDGFLPVIACVGLDEQGQFLNVNGDDAAAGIAKAMHASALVLLTDVAGVLDAKRAIVPRITAGQIEAMIESGEVTGGMIAKLRAASQVATSLKIPVTIMSGQSTQPLEAWARGQAQGTTIVA